MDELLGIVGAGAKTLLKFIPLWLGAKTPEERAAITADAKTKVGGLDAYFDERDATDKASQDALQAQINAAKESAQ